LAPEVPLWLGAPPQIFPQKSGGKGFELPAPAMAMRRLRAKVVQSVVDAHTRRRTAFRTNPNNALPVSNLRVVSAIIGA
jgi:hypothetical protein